MRLLLHTKIPHEKFNAAVRDGTAGEKMQRILAETKPEAVYFTNYDGQRGTILAQYAVCHAENDGFWWVLTG